MMLMTIDTCHHNLMKRVHANRYTVCINEFGHQKNTSRFFSHYLVRWENWPGL